MFIFGTLSAVALFIIILKIPSKLQRRLLGLDIFVDAVATVLLAVAFAGTYTGMAAAIIGGITFSCMMWFAKLLLGYDKMFYYKGKIEWVEIPPVWRRR